METEFARTFLAVVAEGSFVNAASRLHVTQSTVSARIHALEEYLGCTLFVRNKAGAALTPSGRQFQKHASVLVRTLEQARQDVGVPQGFRATLTVGGRFGLWEQLLLQWLPWMRERASDVSIRAEIGFESDLMQRLVEGTMDIGVMYTPQSRPGLIVEQLLEEELILVRRATDEVSKNDERYVHVDWGPEFFDKHRVHFPELHPAAIVVSIGWLGLQLILENGGTGYFPERLVRENLRTGVLARVQGAPSFTLPAYVVSARDSEPEVIGVALEGIREIVSAVRSG